MWTDTDSPTFKILGTFQTLCRLLELKVFNFFIVVHTENLSMSKLQESAVKLSKES